LSVESRRPLFPIPDRNASLHGGIVVTWTQVYDPAGHWWLSTIIAALPILVLLGLLAGLRLKPHICAVAGAATAVLVAILAFKMPALLAVSSFFYGSAFGFQKPSRRRSWKQPGGLAS